MDITGAAARNDVFFGILLLVGIHFPRSYVLLTITSIILPQSGNDLFWKPLVGEPLKLFLALNLVLWRPWKSQLGCHKAHVAGECEYPLHRQTEAQTGKETPYRPPQRLQ